jgi:acyl-CoA thioesterase-1
MTREREPFFLRLNETDPGRRAIQIVAFGDSVTQGVMELGRLSPEETYHRLLQRDLEAFYPTSTINVINSGISGDNAPQGLDRLERDVLNYHPDLLLIAFGLNDSTCGMEGVSAFEQTIRKMIDRVKALGSTTIVVLTPPFMATAKTARIHQQHAKVAGLIIHTQTSGSLAVYAQRLREIAASEGVLLADVYAEWERLDRDGVDLNSWLANGLNHPDLRGHQLAAKTIWNTLMKHR